MVLPENVVDVEFEIFWREVGEAVRTIDTGVANEIEIERGTHGAMVKRHGDRTAIMLYEAKPKQPALLVP